MSPIYKLISLCIVLIFLVGCGQQGVIVVTTTPDIATNPPVPTPMFQTPQPDEDPARCFGFDPDGEFEIISYNYCLDGPFTTDLNSAIIQAVPDGFEIVNMLENADGVVDEYTDMARIKCDEYSCEFRVNNSVVGINGAWGYRQTISDVEPGCKLILITGQGWVNDPPNQHNYEIVGYVNGVEIGRSVFLMQDTSEVIFPFAVVADADITFAALIDVAWATPGHNSYVEVIGIGVLAVPNGYCE